MLFWSRWKKEWWKSENRSEIFDEVGEKTNTFLSLFFFLKRQNRWGKYKNLKIKLVGPKAKKQTNILISKKSIWLLFHHQLHILKGNTNEVCNSMKSAIQWSLQCYQQVLNLSEIKSSCTWNNAWYWQLICWLRIRLYKQ